MWRHRPQWISNFYIVRILPFLRYIHCNFCLNLHITHGDMIQNVSGCFFSEHSVDINLYSVYLIKSSQNLNNTNRKNGIVTSSIELRKFLDQEVRTCWDSLIRPVHIFLVIMLLPLLRVCAWVFACFTLVNNAKPRASIHAGRCTGWAQKVAYATESYTLTLTKLLTDFQNFFTISRKFAARQLISHHTSNASLHSTLWNIHLKN